MSEEYLHALGVADVQAENELFKQWYLLHKGNEKRRGWNPFNARLMDMLCTGVLEQRYDLVHRFAWAVPCSTNLYAVKAFCGGRRIIEIGAGTGYWASLLQAIGQQVTAVDIQPDAHVYTEVLAADGHDYLSCNKHDDAVLMCCWPRSMESWLNAYRGQALIWIGEEEGCTDYIDEDEDTSWQMVQHHLVPQWLGIRDMMKFYQRT